MRSRLICWSFLTIVCCTFLIGAPASAKEKLPVPQWALDAAKTPTPASVGDASAVILFDEYSITVDDQNRAVEQERFAVRILKPQGRRYSHCGVEYDTDEKLDFFHSWTIAPDGRQFQAGDTDFKDEGNYGDADLQATERFRQVTPPGNDPGAVVACETEVHLRPYIDAEDWQIQAPIPVVDEALDLVLAPGRHYSDSWSRYAPVKPVEMGDNHLRWEIKDMPALDLENIHAAPPWEALAARMSVMWGDSSVNGAQNQWKAIGQWMNTLEANRPDPTPEITAKANELTDGAPDLYTKLSRITSYIQKNVRYFIVVKGIGGFQAHYAADIYRNRYGDCKDKTTLLISMLQAVGIHAYYLHVDSERGVIDPAAPSLIGNHMIAAIELPEGEKDPRLMARVTTSSGKSLLIFDPTDQETPVGLIRGELQGAYGNLADGAGSQVLQMPVLPPVSAGLSRKGTFTLTADGALAGDIEDVFTGVDAARERGILLEKDTREVRKSLEEGLSSDLASLALNEYEFHDGTELDKPVALELRVSDAGYAHVAGALLLLRPRVVGSDARVVSDVMESKARKFPIEIGHPGEWRDSFDIALPNGFVVDEIPDPVNLDMDFASYHASVTAKSSLLHYERDYVVRQVEVPASRAADFRKFESAIEEDEQAAAVLKKQ